MADTTTLNEQVRSPLTGAEVIRLATSGANWQATTGTATWFLGGLGINESAQTNISGLAGIQVVEDGSVLWHESLVAINANTFAPGLQFAKTRGSTPSTQTAVALNDGLIAISMYGSDGTAYQSVGGIIGEVDGAVSTNTVPSRLRFRTTATNSPTEALRIDSSQHLLVNQTATAGGGRVEIAQDNTVTNILSLNGYNGATAASFLNFTSTRASSPVATTAMVSGDPLGALDFRGADGTSYILSARIRSGVDAAVSTGIVPGNLRFLTSNTSGTNTEALRIDSSQRVTIGGAANQTNSIFETNGTAALGVDWANVNWTTGNPCVLEFYRSKSGTIGTQTAVASGDTISQITSAGSDGTNFLGSVRLDVVVDAAVATGHVPGRLVILTANSSGTLTEGLRVDSTQLTTFGSSVKTNYSPSSTPTIPTWDGSGQTAISIANAANTIIAQWATGDAFVFISQIETGDCAFYMLVNGTTNSTFIGGSGGIMVASTATPASGKCSVCYNGSTGFNIYNNRGSTSTFKVYVMKLG